MLPFLKLFSATRMAATVKDMVLLAGLRAAIAILALIGKDLALTESERRAVIARIEASLLPAPLAQPPA